MSQRNLIATLKPINASSAVLDQHTPQNPFAAQHACNPTKASQPHHTSQNSLCAGLITQANGRDVLPTDEAAKALNRRPQTMRKWACLENGPIRPIRINGRLAWRVSDLISLLSGEVA